MSANVTQPLFEELDRRESDGILVVLLWNRSDSRLCVVVCDDRTGDSCEIPVSADEALDAFRHPYAYASYRGLLPEGELEEPRSVAA